MKKILALLFAITMVISFTACREMAKDTKDIAEDTGDLAKEAVEGVTGKDNDNNDNKNNGMAATVSIKSYRLATGNVDKTVIIPTINVKNNSQNGLDLAAYFVVEAFQNGKILVEATTDVVDEKFDQKNQSKSIAPGESYDYEWAWYLEDMSDVTVKVTEKANNNVTEETLDIKEQ